MDATFWVMVAVWGAVGIATGIAWYVHRHNREP